VQLLLEKGADIESKNKDGWTPLLRAVEKGHKAIVQLLLEKGADIESKDWNGSTPLVWAAGQGYNTAVAQLLISHASRSA